MGIDRALLDQIQRYLRPAMTRVANTVARGVIQLVNDETRLQLVQAGILDGEDIDGAEHHQAYGFASVPLAGAEAVIVFPSGDRGHPLVVNVSDRRHRPRSGEPGEVVVYNNTGASIRITKDGDIAARAAPGRALLIDDGSGALEPVVKRSEFLSHGHPVPSFGTTAGPIAGAPPAGSAVVFPGTATLEVK
jgi:phage gp45-like